jgi:hypothetical protein
MQVRGTSLLILLIASQAGCGPAPLPPDDVKAQLGQIYKAYQLAAKELKHPPRNEAELKPFLAKVNASEDALHSEGDGKPFVIIWGAVTGPQAMALSKPKEGQEHFPPVLAYEQVGSGGNRRVLFATGQMSVFDEKRFESATFSNNHKPQFVTGAAP